MITNNKKSFNPEKFKLIYKYLYHSSPNSKNLSADEHAYLFSLGDGYGKMTINELRKNGLIWDWSHIRDSNNGALENIFKALEKIIDLKNLEKTYDNN